MTTWDAIDALGATVRGGSGISTEEAQAVLEVLLETFGPSNTVEELAELLDNARTDPHTPPSAVTPLQEAGAALHLTAQRLADLEATQQVTT